MKNIFGPEKFLVPKFFIPKSKNKNNAILMGFDTIEINLVLNCLY